jgi:hypothetical protein
LLSSAIADWERTIVAHSPWTTDEHPTGCSKRPSSKAAGESKPEAYPLGYVEDFDEPRTTLADFFSILIKGTTLPHGDRLNGTL